MHIKLWKASHLRGFTISAKRIAAIASMLLLLGSCQKIYTYRIVSPAQVKNIPADSLKWQYSAGIVTSIPVQPIDDERIMRLAVDESTQLVLKTTERDEYRLQLRSVVVEDKGDGLLGATTSWRGYDLRQHALRSVMIREVTDMKVWATSPAVERISPKQ